MHVINKDIGKIKSPLDLITILGHVFEYFLGEFEGQLKEETELNRKILENIARVSLKDEN